MSVLSGWGGSVKVHLSHLGPRTFQLSTSDGGDTSLDWAIVNRTGALFNLMLHECYASRTAQTDRRALNQV